MKCPAGHSQSVRKLFLSRHSDFGSINLTVLFYVHQLLNLQSVFDRPTPWHYSTEAWTFCGLLIFVCIDHRKFPPRPEAASLDIRTILTRYTFCRKFAGPPWETAAEPIFRTRKQLLDHGTASAQRINVPPGVFRLDTPTNYGCRQVPPTFRYTLGLIGFLHVESTALQRHMILWMFH